MAAKKGYYTIWFFVSLTSMHFLLSIPCPLVYPNRGKHTYFKLAICTSESKIWKALCAHICCFHHGNPGVWPLVGTQYIIVSCKSGAISAMITATLSLNVCKLVKHCETKPVNTDRCKCEEAASFPYSIPQEWAGLLVAWGFAVEMNVANESLSCVADWAE